MGEVAGLWRYPVKSMGGERLEAAVLDADGMLGDRCWALRDDRRGGLTEARKMPGLLGLASRYPEGDHRPAEITLPDGTAVRTDDPEVNQALSDALGHPLSLWPRRPADDLAHYRRVIPEDADDQYMLDLFAVDHADELPDLSSMPVEIYANQTIPGSYFDWAPVHLVTEQTLAALADLAPDSDVDVRRFRPNLVVRADGDGFPENDWTGRTLRVGTAVLRVTDRTPRCAMITHPQDGLPKDRALAKVVHAKVDHCVGVYAEVERPGVVNVGDEVTF